jgi:hypothetical protein
VKGFIPGLFRGEDPFLPIKNYYSFLQKSPDRGKVFFFSPKLSDEFWAHIAFSSVGTGFHSQG